LSFSRWALFNSPSRFMSLLLSIARTWSTRISLNLSSWFFFKCTLKISMSFFTFVVIGQTSVEGWVSFSKSVCTTTTGRVLPGSVPRLGFRSASQISNCLIRIHEAFKFVQHVHGILTGQCRFFGELLLQKSSFVHPVVYAHRLVYVTISGQVQLAGNFFRLLEYLVIQF
jgi:hypothetical protein